MKKAIMEPDTTYKIVSIAFIIMAIVGFGYEIFTGLRLNIQPMILLIVGLLYAILSKLN